MGRCQYIFQKGPYMGEKCLRCCEDNLCTDHNKKKIGGINRGSLDLQDINIKIKISNKLYKTAYTLGMQIKKLENECSRCARLYYGYLLRINPDYKVPVRKKILREMESKNFKRMCKKEYGELDSHSQKRYGYFAGYLRASKEKYLSYPNTYINVIPFNGSITEAEREIQKVIIRYGKYREHIITLKNLLSECEAKMNENGTYDSVSDSESSKPNSEQSYSETGSENDGEYDERYGSDNKS